jgi:hypothetical protein
VCVGRCVGCRSDTVGGTEVNCVCVCLGRCVECRSDTVGGTEVNCVCVWGDVLGVVQIQWVVLR